MSDFFGGLVLGVIGLCIGVACGVGWGKDIADVKWCERMKDTTWSECVTPGQQVKVIKDVP